MRHYVNITCSRNIRNIKLRERLKTNMRFVISDKVVAYIRLVKKLN